MQVANIRDHPNWKAEGGVYIGRGFRGQRASDLANPFRIGKDGNRDRVISKYKRLFQRRLKEESGFAGAIERLRGKTLVCWCAPKPCHGDVIIEYLEGEKDG